MLDLHHFKRRNKAIRDAIGISKDDIYRIDKNQFSVYFNPSTGLITGIKDNERNVFYHYDRQDDLINFVGMVNLREERFSGFVQGVELQIKQFIDREIEMFDKIDKLNDEIDSLKSENKQLKEELSCNNIKF